MLVSELMVDPKAVSDADGEWFELHNPGSDPVDLQGCAIFDGGAQPRILNEALTAQPGAYLTIARSETAGFVPTTIATFSLSNGADVLELQCDGVVIDRVEYDKAVGFPVKPGIAMSLDARSMSAERNDAAAAWCPARDAFAVDLGSPGGANPPCPSAEVGAGD